MLRTTSLSHRSAAVQAALADMTDELNGLLQEELVRLRAARAVWRAEGAVADLHLVAHDLKGLGATYGAPLVGRVAASLERVLGYPHAPARLVEAHVDAVLAMVRENAVSAGDAEGETLAAALETAFLLPRGAPGRQAA